ncbi:MULTISPECIES: hypothetical protein [unclassified Paenibacillus]|uniref:hypothetical protein n=1 Tax=unclassified Paenibacillus TaxID=185978 RepID=UPI00105183FA|nr:MULTISPECIES: hypothetical protein [unclassified Paenibacillus]NIK72017.1 hypothetical protein [Paenibacillus sp. BK720]TCM89783.1 hypothetical protein EV294_11170 [Paenibacillus sp. BK033]
MKYIWLWAVYIFLFTAAAIGLEILEGNKITTTEYYGLRNMGSIFVMFCLLSSIALYVVTFLPLTLLLTRFVKLLPARIILYSIAGGIVGIWVFDQFYDLGDEYYVKGYGLNVNSALILFGLAGFVYAVTDTYLGSKKK